MHALGYFGSAIAGAAGALVLEHLYFKTVEAFVSAHLQRSINAAQADLGKLENKVK